MPTSTLQSDPVPATEPGLLMVDAEPATDLKPAAPGVVLSAQAKERLKVLNKALANCISKSMGDGDSTH